MPNTNQNARVVERKRKGKESHALKAVEIVSTENFLQIENRHI